MGIIGNFLFPFLLLVFLAPALPKEVTVIDTNDYIYLILDVHYYYRTSCVFFIEVGEYDDLVATTLMHSWHLEFSKRRVFSMTMSFPDLSRNARKYQRRIVRPLFVVLITSHKSLEQFISTTQKVEMSFPVWFVIFVHFPGNPFHELCEFPSLNIFNVKFSTEMLVFCYGHASLNEWYAVRDNITRTFELATWSPGTGLKLTTTRSLYGRRSNVFGETLTVATVSESPFTSVKNGKLYDLFGNVLQELSRAMNFRTNILPSAEAYGSYNKEKNEWTGVIAQLVSGEADIGVAEFTMTTHRLDAVDFTLPLMLSRNRLYLRGRGGAAVQWSGYFQAFKTDIWSVIIILIVSTPILLTVMKTRGSIATRIMTENYIHIWGIYCQQGLSEFPTNSSLRLAYFSIFISALIVSSAYSASLISFLTVTSTTLPFTTLEGFVADHSYKMAVFKNSADYDMFMNSNDKVLQDMGKLILPKNDLPLVVIEGFKLACTKKVVFYTTEVIKQASSFHLPCKINHIESGRIDSLAMTLSKGNPYTGLINYHLQRFRDNGMLNKIKGNYLTKTVVTHNTHDSVGLWGVAPILAVLAGGIILGVFVLLLEKSHHAYHRRSKRRAKFLNAKDKSTTDGGLLKKSKNELKTLVRFQVKDQNYYGVPKVGYWP